MPSDPELERAQPVLLTIAAVAPEGRAQGRVLVRQVQHVLRHGRALDDAPDFDGAFFFDEFADREEECG